MSELFPGGTLSEGIGGFLHELLNEPASDGAPYTHTFQPPRCECDDDECTCAPPPAVSLTMEHPAGGALALGLLANFGLAESSVRMAMREQSYMAFSREIGATEDDARRVLSTLISELRARGLALDDSAFGIARRRLLYQVMGIVPEIWWQSPGLPREFSGYGTAIASTFILFDELTPPLAIDGHAYRQRRRNRVKRRRR